MLSDDLKYQLLHQLEQDPEASQRAIAKHLGISLGKTNYCLRAVIDKGWVKARNFRNSQKKTAYMYMLTPKGVSAKARITKRFLNRKIAEYQQLEQEIRNLRNEVEGKAKTPAPD